MGLSPFGASAPLFLRNGELLVVAHCMVRAAATVVWYRFPLSRKKQLDIFLTYFNLCKGDKNHRVLYVLYL
jgi:hypothetical protein